MTSRTLVEGGGGSDPGVEVKGESWKREWPFIPAMARTMSMVLVGEYWMLCLKAWVRDVQSETSVWMKVTLWSCVNVVEILMSEIAYLDPLLLNSAAYFSPASALISAIVTIAPASASAFAVAAPIPDAPPVTSAVLPLIVDLSIDFEKSTGPEMGLDEDMMM